MNTTMSLRQHLHGLRAAAISVAILLVLAGCVTSFEPEEEDQGFSSPVQVDNHDSRFLALTHGIYQLTNTSADHPSRLSVFAGDGWAVWYEGGFELPSGMHAQRMGEGEPLSLPTPDGLVTQRRFILKDTLVITFGHVVANDIDALNRTMVLWHLAEDLKSYRNLTFDKEYSPPQGFDGQWLLMSLREGGSPRGIVTMNWTTGDILPVRTQLEDHETIGSRFLLDGIVYYTLLDTRAGTRTPIAYDLNTGLESRPLRGIVESYTIEAVTTAHVYLRQCTEEEGCHLFAAHLHTGQVQQLTEGKVQVEHVVAGGDWVLFAETELVRPDNLPWWDYGETRLIAVDISNMARFELFPRQDDFAPDIRGTGSWATDGKHVVFKARTLADSPNIKYPGSQLYWMHLPRV